MSPEANSLEMVDINDTTEDVKNTIKGNKLIKPRNKSEGKNTNLKSRTQKKQRTISDFQNVKTVHVAVRTNNHVISSDIKPKNNSKGKQKVEEVDEEKDEEDDKDTNTTKIDITARHEKFHFQNALNPEFDLQDLANSNWSSNRPLSSSDFVSIDNTLHDSMVSIDDKEAKNEKSFLKNMKRVPYAGDIVKIMSFINKFYNVFDPELLNVSFQEFEVGLNLYPELYNNSTDEIRPYSEYLDSDYIIQCQGKMNLIFLTTLKLLLTNFKTDNQNDLHRPYATMQNLKAKDVFTKLVRGMRQNANTWGLPREWRNQYLSVPLESKESTAGDNEDTADVTQSSSSNGTNSELEHYVEMTVPSIPIYNMQLGKIGIFGIEPTDRIILLRTIITWCCAHSTKIHNEIYRLTHNKEPEFGVYSQHVNRLTLEGRDLNIAQFYKLCKLVEIRYEKRLKRIKSRKPMTKEKYEEFDNKVKVLKEIQKHIEKSPEDEKITATISLYNEWLKIFSGDFISNPLSNPFEDSIYKVRSLEFFVGRLPQLGDFYLPQLSTYYQESESIPPYTDTRSLYKYFKKISSSKLGNIEELALPKFKLLFYDTFAAIQDTINEDTQPGHSYWYEICDDINSLKIFLDSIDEYTKETSKDIINSETDSDILEKCLFFARLEILRDYLGNIYSTFNEIEVKKIQFNDIASSSRSLRSFKRRKVNYTDEDDNNFNGNDDADKDYSEEKEVIEDEEEEFDKELTGGEVYNVKESRNDRMQRRRGNRT